MKKKLIKNIKRKKGFTLIELLAVILILGIIALIAIPTVTSVVEQSRKGAAESSASQFVSSVAELAMRVELNGEILTDGIYDAKDLEEKGLSIKGTTPDFGIVQIENGEVVRCSLSYGNYNVMYDGVSINSRKESDKIFTISEDNDSNNEVSVKDKVCFSNECFYVVGVEGDNVRLLAEWNLNVGYNITHNGNETFSYYDFYDYGNSLIYNDELGGYYNAIRYDKIQTSNAKIMQDKNILGMNHVGPGESDVQIKGVTKFANLDQNNYSEETRYNGYWTNNGALLPSYGSSYPTYVYNENSTLSKYINAYVDNIKVMSGNSNISGDLLNLMDFFYIGCSQESGTCGEDVMWLFNTTYWTGVAVAADDVICLTSNYSAEMVDFTFSYVAGVRPVITVPKNIVG